MDSQERLSKKTILAENRFKPCHTYLKAILQDDQLYTRKDIEKYMQDFKKPLTFRRKV